MNAAVGPPTWKRLPPSAEMRKPATMAVTRPCAGVAPGRDTDRHRQRQRYDRDRQAGDNVAAKSAAL